MLACTPWPTVGGMLAVVVTVAGLLLGAFALNDAVVTVECSLEVEKVMAMIHTWGPHSPSLYGMGSFDCALDGIANTPLHIVASYAATDPYREGSLTMLARQIAGAGGRPTAPNFKGETALHIASAQCSSSIAAALISTSGAVDAVHLVTMQDGNEHTSLDYAVGAFCTKAARMQLGYAAPLTLDEKTNRCTLELISGVLLGHASDLNETLKSYARNASLPTAGCTIPWDRRNRKLLHFAVAASDVLSSEERAAVIQVLVAHGASPTSVDATGEAPLAVAARLDRADVADLLLSLSPPEAVAAVDLDNRTALHVAAIVGAHTSSRLLMKNGAPVDVQDASGLTPLEYAELGGYTRVASAIRTVVEHPPETFTNEVAPTPTEAGAGPNEYQVATDGTDQRTPIDMIVVIFGTIAGLIFVCSLGLCLRQYVCKRRTSSKLVHLQSDTPALENIEIKPDHDGQVDVADARHDPRLHFTVPGRVKDSPGSPRPSSLGSVAQIQDFPDASTDGGDTPSVSSASTARSTHHKLPLSERQQQRLQESKRRSQEREGLRNELRRKQLFPQDQPQQQPEDSVHTVSPDPLSPGSRASTLGRTRSLVRAQPADPSSPVGRTGTGGSTRAAGLAPRADPSSSSSRAITPREGAPPGGNPLRAQPATPGGRDSPAVETPAAPLRRLALGAPPPVPPVPSSGRQGDARRTAEAHGRGRRASDNSVSPSPAEQLRQQRALLNLPAAHQGNAAEVRQAAQRQPPPAPRIPAHQSVI